MEQPIEHEQVSKYVCGCGKIYGSYPAFSTHRKIKHNNETVQGSKIPKIHDPKRGRPSYEFKKLQKLNVNQQNYYDGLTIIQLGLLNLDSKFNGKIIREYQTDFIPNIDSQLKRQSHSNQTFFQILKFLELFVLHMNDQPAKVASKFLIDLGLWGLYSPNKGEPTMLNQYFAKKQFKKQKNNVYGREFQIEICLILSNWMNKMGIWNSNIIQKINK